MDRIEVFKKIKNYTPFINNNNYIIPNGFYIVALIPARSGSKGLPGKNIKLYKGIPLIAHSINIAKESLYINDIYVSTDSEEYAEIARNCGAKVPFLRPKSISGDLSPDIDTFTHFLNYFRSNNLHIPDIIVQLRPTYPNRSLMMLNKTINMFINNYSFYDSLRTVVPIKKSPFKMYYIEKVNNDFTLTPFIKEYNNLNEPYNQARQNFPNAYLHNGCIDIIKTDVIMRLNKLSGNNIYPYIMDENEIDDIDEQNDFDKAESKNI